MTIFAAEQIGIMSLLSFLEPRQSFPNNLILMLVNHIATGGEIKDK